MIVVDDRHVNSAGVLSLTALFRSHVFASELFTYSEAMSLTPLPPMFARSNSRYNSFQTRMTTAAAQAHDAAITRPREYLGASVEVSNLYLNQTTHGDDIPPARNSWLPGKLASWMLITYAAKAIGRLWSSIFAVSHAALSACAEPMLICVHTTPPDGVSTSQSPMRECSPYRIKSTCRRSKAPERARVDQPHRKDIQ